MGLREGSDLSFDCKCMLVEPPANSVRACVDNLRAADVFSVLLQRGNSRDSFPLATSGTLIKYFAARKEGVDTWSQRQLYQLKKGQTVKQ